MKTKIFLVTTTSYTASDNYLFNDVKTFTDEQEAISEYDNICNNLRQECRWGADYDNDDHTDDYEYNMSEAHHTHEVKGNGYMLTYEASSDAYEGYRVQVKLECQEVEINAPATWLFDREHFTEAQVNAVTIEEALQLSDGTSKSERKVWRYEGNSGTFAADFNRGCITPDKYFIRII